MVKCALCDVAVQEIRSPPLQIGWIWECRGIFKVVTHALALR